MELHQHDGAIVRTAKLQGQLAQLLRCFGGRLVLCEKLPAMAMEREKERGKKTRA